MYSRWQETRAPVPPRGPSGGRQESPRAGHVLPSAIAQVAPALHAHCSRPHRQPLVTTCYRELEGSLGGRTVQGNSSRGAAGAAGLGLGLGLDPPGRSVGKSMLGLRPPPGPSGRPESPA